MKSCRLDAVTLHEDSGAAPGHVKGGGMACVVETADRPAV